MGQSRHIERYWYGNWMPIPGGIQKLRKGDRFRVFEPDGTPHVAIAGRTEFVAISEPYQFPMTGVWTIRCEAEKDL